MKYHNNYGDDEENNEDVWGLRGHGSTKSLKPLKNVFSVILSQKIKQKNMKKLPNNSSLETNKTQKIKSDSTSLNNCYHCLNIRGGER